MPTSPSASEGWQSILPSALTLSDLACNLKSSFPGVEQDFSTLYLNGFRAYLF